MIKIINLISLIIAPIIVGFKNDQTPLLTAIAVAATIAVGIAIWHSKKETLELKP